MMRESLAIQRAGLDVIVYAIITKHRHHRTLQHRFWCLVLPVTIDVLYGPFKALAGTSVATVLVGLYVLCA